MRSRVSLLLKASLALVLAVGNLTASGQQFKPATHGIQARADGIVLQISSLREDVLRVRMWKEGKEPEDASWAVLPEARKSFANVVAEPRGFHTRQLRVTIGAGLELTVADMNGKVLQRDAEPVSWHGESFLVRKDRAPEDSFFGLGDKPGPLDRSGQTFAMWNTDTFGWQESTDPIYKSIPFFIDFKDGKALGVLVDNTWRSFFDFGRENSNQISFGAPNGPIDYYLLYGPEPKQVVSTYAWLTGPTPLPPLWSFGFQQSRYSYYPESELMAVASRLRADKIPSDALYLDIDFQKKNRPFTVDDEHYPHFSEMVKQLAQDHFHLVLITDLHIARLPNSGYAPYDSGTAGDQFVKNPDGSTFVGDVWPGPSVFPDFTQATTRAWWGTLYKDFATMGVAGFWNDMNEPAVFGVSSKTMPDNVQHRIQEPGFAQRTASHAEIHNVYGMENSRGTYEGLLALRPNERPFVLTRASYAGGQRYAATWTGDNSSTWNHLRMTVPQIVNLGLSGFSMSGADVGGFAGSPSPDLLTKWIELAAFQPIDRDHAAKGTRPHEVWVDGPMHEGIRKRYIEERYRLMPYLYTAAEENSRDGVPIMRPLFLEFPHANANGRAMDLDTGGGEFLFGRRILVAPNPSPEEVAPYEVHLPPGTWYDYWTGERYERTQKTQTLDLEQREKLTQEKPLMVKPSLDILPVYVQGGSIVPLAPLTQSLDETPQGSLTVRIYLASERSEACDGEVYADDGKSFDYRNGEYARVRFSCSQQSDGSLQINVLPQEGRYKPWWKSYRFEVRGWNPQGKDVKVSGAPATLERDGAGVTIISEARRAGLQLLLK
jgi:alpha-glucosidase